MHSICRGVEFPDLLPAGVAGLERAIARFDASKGFKFSTYAHWWIRQAISRCVQVRGIEHQHEHSSGRRYTKHAVSVR